MVIDAVGVADVEGVADDDGVADADGEGVMVAAEVGVGEVLGSGRVSQPVSDTAAPRGTDTASTGSLPCVLSAAAPVQAASVSQLSARPKSYTAPHVALWTPGTRLRPAAVASTLSSHARPGTSTRAQRLDSSPELGQLVLAELSSPRSNTKLAASDTFTCVPGCPDASGLHTASTKTPPGPGSTMTPVFARPRPVAIHWMLPGRQARELRRPIR